MNQPIDFARRLKVLNRRLDRMSKKLTRVDTRQYASTFRRAEMSLRQSERIKRWLKLLDDNAEHMVSLGKLIKRMRTGRIIPMLTYQQNQLLRYILQRRGWYKPHMVVRLPKVSAPHGEASI